MTPKLHVLFQRLCDCAIRGERCPTADQLAGLPPPSELAHAGKIRIEVFARNWRVVTILTGPHAGKSTMRDPAGVRGAKPYRVIDGSSLTTRGSIPPEQRRAPWKPGDPKPVPATK